MKVYETWIRESTYDQGRLDMDNKWVGIFSSYEKAESIGLDALKNVLMNKITIRRGKRGEHPDIYAMFDEVKYDLCIDEVELDQRYDNQSK